MSTFLSTKLAFIGGGNMARSLVGGLIAKGMAPANITVSDPLPTQLESLQQQYKVNVIENNHSAVRDAEIVVLAVKPQELPHIAQELSPALLRKPLIISVAAGIRASDLEQWLRLPVVRAMPNRPALNGCGMTGMYAPVTINAAQRALALQIMSAVGKAIWVESETLIDAVTAVSGSGPAYFFLLMELLETAGIEQGLPADVARTLAIETAYGSGYMARELMESPATLRTQVTSKGGTTEAALKVFAARDLKSIVSEAVKVATSRSAEMAEQLTK